MLCTCTQCTIGHAIRTACLEASADELLEQQCPLCGEAMLQLVAEPFIAPADVTALASWAVA